MGPIELGQLHAALKSADEYLHVATHRELDPDEILATRECVVNALYIVEHEKKQGKQEFVTRKDRFNNE